MTFYRRPSGKGCFRRVSRRKDNGETDKSSWKRIVTFLLKLSSQCVKYALACVYIDLAISEMKKKKRKCLSSSLARGRMATACFFPSGVRHGRGKLPKGKAQFKRRSFHVPNLIPI